MRHRHLLVAMPPAPANVYRMIIIPSGCCRAQVAGQYMPQLEKYLTASEFNNALSRINAQIGASAGIYLIPSFMFLLGFILCMAIGASTFASRAARDNGNVSFPVFVPIGMGLFFCFGISMVFSLIYMRNRRLRNTFAELDNINRQFANRQISFQAPQLFIGSNVLTVIDLVLPEPLPGGGILGYNPYAGYGGMGYPQPAGGAPNMVVVAPAPQYNYGSTVAAASAPPTARVDPSAPLLTEPTVEGREEGAAGGYCSKCGRMLRMDDVFCAKCGTRANVSVDM